MCVRRHDNCRDLNFKANPLNELLIFSWFRNSRALSATWDHEKVKKILKTRLRIFFMTCRPPIEHLADNKIINFSFFLDLTLFLLIFCVLFLSFWEIWLNGLFCCRRMRWEGILKRKSSIWQHRNDLFMRSTRNF